MKITSVVIAATMALISIPSLSAETLSSPESPQMVQIGSDFQVIKDEVKDGIRYVSATPSAKVCSKQIDIQIDVKTQKIVKCSFTRGCPGNAIGLCSLIEGMTCQQVITRLEGINCAGRGTSCPDQLARILRSLKW